MLVSLFSFFRTPFAAALEARNAELERRLDEEKKARVDERLYFAREVGRARREREVERQRADRLTDRLLERRGIEAVATASAPQASTLPPGQPTGGFESLAAAELRMQALEDKALLAFGPNGEVSVLTAPLVPPATSADA